MLCQEPAGVPGPVWGAAQPRAAALCCSASLLLKWAGGNILPPVNGWSFATWGFVLLTFGGNLYKSKKDSQC